MEKDGELSLQEREDNRVAQEEELEALEAIYGDAFENVAANRGSAACDQAPSPPRPEVRVRVSEIPLISLYMRLPESYPSRELPEVEVRAPGLGQAARRELSQALRPIGDKALPLPGGTVVIFDWVEKLLDLLSRKAYPAESGDRSSSNTNRSRASTDRADANLSDRRSATDGGGEEWSGGDGASSGQDGAGWRPVAKGVGGESEAFVEIVHGEAFTDRKSTFQAHLARVFSERQVLSARHRLMENGKIARATHNVAAWRLWDVAKGVQLHDNDDDGESAAGSRLAHMLAITGAQNVLVVVSRWYGGIHLGPDRFKHINNAARKLLVQCRATADGNLSENKLKGKGGGGGKQRGGRKRG